MKHSLYRVTFAQRSMLWGGAKLAQRLAIDEPLSPLAEVYAFSALQPDPSIIIEGPFKHQSIPHLYQTHPELFGHPKQTNFPLLIKFIDAQSNLSIQVHPNDDYAFKHEDSYGKSEAWLILETEPDGFVYLGHHCTTPEQLQKAIQDNQVLSILETRPVQENDLINVPAGTVHAINAGILLYEVQQSSLLTYRVYDYERKDTQGRVRDLHLKQALDVTSVPDQSTTAYIQTISTTAMHERRLENDHFIMRVIEVNEACTLELLEPYAIIGCVKGKGLINGLDFKMGTHALALSDVETIEVRGAMTIVISSPRKEHI